MTNWKWNGARDILRKQNRELMQKLLTEHRPCAHKDGDTTKEVKQ